MGYGHRGFGAIILDIIYFKYPSAPCNVDTIHEVEIEFQELPRDMLD
jgi:hypothetical protein